MRILLLAAWLVFSVELNSAMAHVTLLDTEPADGAVLATAPEIVTLRFADPVMPESAQIIGSDKIKRPIELKADGDVVRLSLPRGLPPGTYVLSWTVSSFDNHPVVGSMMLVVGQGRVAATAGGEIVRLKLTDHGLTVDLGVQPAVSGRNRLEARFEAGVTPKEVAVELSQPSLGIKPFRRLLQAQNGVYVLDGLDLVVAGTWNVTLDVLINDFDKAFFDTELTIR